MKKKFILPLLTLVMVIALVFGLAQVFGPPDPAPAPAEDAGVVMTAQEIDASLVLDQATITLTGIDAIATSNFADLNINDIYAIAVLLTTAIGIILVLSYILIRMPRTVNGIGSLKTRVWRLGCAI